MTLPAPDARGVTRVEIDPLLAEDEDGFRAALPVQPRVLAAGHLYEAP